MVQHLEINGKTYIKGNILAARFGYTADYLGKLARDERVLGTQIGRQWYIEEGSLATFLQQAEIERALRAQELKHRRKLERALHVRKSTGEESPDSISLALMQTVVVCACLCFLGGLAGVVLGEGLVPADLAKGAQQAFALVLLAI